jgi:hypothetical protein
MQLNGYIIRVGKSTPQGILPNSIFGRDSLDWTTPVESWTIDAGFYGIGLPHLGVEAVIAMTNKLLMHYGCNTAMG